MLTFRMFFSKSAAFFQNCFLGVGNKFNVVSWQPNWFFNFSGVFKGCFFEGEGILTDFSCVFIGVIVTREGVKISGEILVCFQWFSNLFWFERILIFVYQFFAFLFFPNFGCIFCLWWFVLLEQDFSKSSSLFVFKKRQITIMVGWFFGHFKLCQHLFDQKFSFSLQKQNKEILEQKERDFFFEIFPKMNEKLK